MPRTLSTRFRRAHLLVVPLDAAPLRLTAASGSRDIPTIDYWQRNGFQVVGSEPPRDQELRVRA